MAPRKTTQPLKCAPLLPVRILSRKWSYLTLRALREPMRFSQLHLHLRYPTNRVLSRELSQLTEEGLVTHEEGLYRLTASGLALYTAIGPLAEWSVRHRSVPVCSDAQSCAHCSGYAETVGMRPIVRIGSK